MKTWANPKFGEGVPSPDQKAFFKENFFEAPDGTDATEWAEVNAGILDGSGSIRYWNSLDQAIDVKSLHLSTGEISDIDAFRGEGCVDAFFGFYALNYKVESVSKMKDIFTVYVSFVGQGFEQVVVPWPYGGGRFLVHVIDKDGVELWHHFFESHSTVNDYLNLPVKYFPFQVCVDRELNAHEIGQLGAKDVTGSRAIEGVASQPIKSSNTLLQISDLVAERTLNGVVLYQYQVKETKFDWPTNYLTVELQKYTGRVQAVIFTHPLCLTNCHMRFVDTNGNIIVTR